VLHDFSQPFDGVGTNADGLYPVADLVLSGNTLYGTTLAGGNSSSGTVFKVNVDGSGYAILHSFSDDSSGANSDGANPRAGLVLSGKTLYGTAFDGGLYSAGTAFSLTTNGTSFTVWHTMTNTPEAGFPSGDLTIINNIIYGTTSGGGSYGYGKIFSTPLADGVPGITSTTIHSFKDGGDGAYPCCALVLGGSTLYGTATNGGAGYGTVFAVTATANGSGNVVHTFTNGADGAFPYASLVLYGTKLYGTATAGGTNGNGTVFSVNMDGSGFTVLHTFSALDPAAGTNSDGATPFGSLTLAGGTLYGTTSAGGTANDGTIFAVGADGSGFKVLHEFLGQVDGANPLSGLVFSGNKLYGTAASFYSGGGTLFAVNADGTDFTVLHLFGASANADGAVPYAGLTAGGGVLYGDTSVGGAYGAGTIFSVNLNSSNYTTLYSFTGGADGANNNGGANLLLLGGTLYGTATAGGAGNGTVFSLSTNGTDFTVLHEFSSTDPASGTNWDGADPNAGLVANSNLLFGTTSKGGLNANGAIFSVSTNGGNFLVLHSFGPAGTNDFGQATNVDGINPFANLTLAGGALFGATASGGVNAAGTLFSLGTNGENFSVLHSFSAAIFDGSGENTNIDGANPYLTLVLQGGILYGTTTSDGPYGSGTIFSLNTNGGDFSVLYAFSSLNDGTNFDGSEPGGLFLEIISMGQLPMVG